MGRSRRNWNEFIEGMFHAVFRLDEGNSGLIYYLSLAECPWLREL